MNKAGVLKNLFLRWLAGWLIAWPAVCMADELTGWLNCRAASGLGILSVAPHLLDVPALRDSLGQLAISHPDKLSSLSEVWSCPLV